MNARVCLLLLVTVGYATMWSYDKQDRPVGKPQAAIHATAEGYAAGTPHENRSLLAEVHSAAVDCQWSEFDGHSLCDVALDETADSFSRRASSRAYTRRPVIDDCMNAFSADWIPPVEYEARFASEAADLGEWTGPALSMQASEATRAHCQSTASVADRFMNRCSVVSAEPASPKGRYDAFDGERDDKVVNRRQTTAREQRMSQKTTWARQVSRTATKSPGQRINASQVSVSKVTGHKASGHPYMSQLTQGQIPLPAHLPTGHYRVVRSDGWTGKIYCQANETISGSAGKAESIGGPYEYSNGEFDWYFVRIETRTATAQVVLEPAEADAASSEPLEESADDSVSSEFDVWSMILPVMQHGLFLLTL